MFTSQKLTRILLGWLLLGTFYGAARAADPGLQADFSITKSGPATVAAGDNVTYTIVVTNNSSFSLAVNANVNDTLPAGFTVVSVSGPGATCAAATNSFNCAVSLMGGSSVTITLVAHVPGVCQAPTAINTATVTPVGVTDPNPANNTAMASTEVTQPALGPGLCRPPGSAIADDKPGSILFAPFYISSASGDLQNNTRINLTNTHPTMGVALHLFFVDGATCSVADVFLCLTKNQTTSFLMSDLDPGVSGYLMVVAVDGPPGFAEGGNTGCPISFNFLIGNANIKFIGSPRRDLDLSMEAVAAEFGSPVPGCNPNSVTAELIFDGSPRGYNRLPRVLAADNIPSRRDGNDTILIVTRINGNYATGLAPLGTLFGLFYDDAENALSFTFNATVCQFRSSLSNNFPRLTPRFETFVPAGRSGWLKIWAGDGVAIIGAQHNRNDNSGASPAAFEGGHNLHKLTLLPTATIIVPIFPPSC